LAEMMYASDSNENLPTMYRTASSFTTYWFKDTSYRNLGLLDSLNYMTAPLAFYCLSRDSRPNEVLAYNAPGNEWTNSKVRSSYPVRQVDTGGIPVTTGNAEWKVTDYTLKVIVSDFVGVVGYEGGGINTGAIYAVHDGNGFNRLFGDGSVRWTKPGPLTSKINNTVPSPVQLMNDYLELDTLP
jgi:prepilin-type processing-associated H-X9-DG protein